MVTWTSTGMNTTATSALKSAGADSWTNAIAYTDQSLTAVTGQPKYTSYPNGPLLALTSSPSSVSNAKNDTDFAFVGRGTADKVGIFENGVQQGSDYDYSDSTTMEIKHTTSDVEYYIGGVLKRTVATTVSSLYGLVSAYEGTTSNDPNGYEDMTFTEGTPPSSDTVLLPPEPAMVRL